MNRLFRVIPTARAHVAAYSTQTIRNPHISNAIPLPVVQVSAPDFASQPTHLRRVHGNLQANGVIQVQLQFKDAESNYLKNLISNLHQYHNHGLPITHSAERGWFWDVRPSPASFQPQEHQARSETMSQFEWHTDCSYEANPPRFFALQVLQPDRYGGGTLSVLNVDRLLTLLSPFAQKWLSSNDFKITVPPEFIKNESERHIIGNLLVVPPGGKSGSQLRFREDITEALTPNAAKALDELKSILNGGESQKEILHLSPERLPEGSVIMMDNRRWLHSRNEVKDPNRHLRRVRWDATPFTSGDHEAC
ncbi:Taurine catabolism dioxygenase TauD/TfdA [Penicillium angulare]|uniref:Taurine catabolism dioxygenase TauD/TfdA n=1 Tax=Penicillium angulare TaxID=116970 RepID=UPI00253F6616|nr:Taurine catabolism dioxygenase TauD/TfdA [Penicillium angulare]KAJ5273185.1 Taurine catabolism dioxygenase TauD/TfdA [Penicillium angulare]